MLSYPKIDPVALSIGPLDIHWYGITYLVAFAGFWFFARLKSKQHHVNWTYEQIDDLLFYGALGVVLGGRIGYTLFYNFDYFMHDPLVLFQIQRGGMSFHGGCWVCCWPCGFLPVKIRRRFLRLPILLPLWCRSGWRPGGLVILSTPNSGGGQRICHGR